MQIHRYKRIKLDLMSRWDAINAGTSYQSNGHIAFSVQVEGRKGFQTSTDKLSKDFTTTSTIYSPLQEAATSYATTMTTLRYIIFKSQTCTPFFFKPMI
jgi:hypothetical protein